MTAIGKGESEGDGSKPVKVKRAKGAKEKQRALQQLDLGEETADEPTQCDTYPTPDTRPRPSFGSSRAQQSPSHSFAPGSSSNQERISAPYGSPYGSKNYNFSTATVSNGSMVQDGVSHSSLPSATLITRNPSPREAEATPPPYQSYGRNAPTEKRRRPRGQQSSPYALHSCNCSNPSAHGHSGGHALDSRSLSSATASSGDAASSLSIPLGGFDHPGQNVALPSPRSNSDSPSMAQGSGIATSYRPNTHPHHSGVSEPARYSAFADAFARSRDIIDQDIHRMLANAANAHSSDELFTANCVEGLLRHIRRHAELHRSNVRSLGFIG